MAYLVHSVFCGVDVLKDISTRTTNFLTIHYSADCGYF